MNQKYAAFVTTTAVLIGSALILGISAAAQSAQAVHEDIPNQGQCQNALIDRGAPKDIAKFDCREEGAIQNQGECIQTYRQIGRPDAEEFCKNIFHHD
jgi:hypothetical protein